MKYFSPYRLATYFLVLFTMGHTAGGMLSNKSVGPQGDAVFASMRSVHFQFNGSDCTYHGFWFGFGIMVSVFLLLSAFTAWHLASVKQNDWHVVSPIAWALVASHIATAILSWKYFFVGPGIISTIVVVLLTVGAIRPQVHRSVA